ncbi:MAG: AAA family ATPase [Candidatus Woesearchaeota archaeon]
MTKAKLLDTYNFIKNNIYFCSSDITIGFDKYNSELIFGLLSSLLNNKILYVGEYGLGKTTLAETISSLTTNLPISIISSSSLKGHPELSYEYIVGRPDLGLLNKGEEKVLWSDFVQVPSKIIDEVNRIPESKQNILLSGMQTNSWNFLNDNYQSKSSAWFATANYKDQGNYSIIPPLLDRFDLCLETKSPNINIARMIRSKKTASLVYSNYLNQYKKNLNTPNLDDTLNDISMSFKKELFDQYGLELLSKEEIKKINQDIKSIAFTKETNLFLDLLISEFTSCSQFGVKRSTDSCPSGCHYNTYSCSKIKSPISIRTQSSIANYSKALAWLRNDNEVKMADVVQVTPYAVWHKNFIKESYSQNKQLDKRDHPTSLEISFNLVNDVVKRFSKLKGHQEEIIDYILKKDYVKAKTKAKSMDHPVFESYVK